VDVGPILQAQAAKLIEPRNVRSVDILVRERV
jgi:hypothetical protein